MIAAVFVWENYYYMKIITCKEDIKATITNWANDSTGVLYITQNECSPLVLNNTHGFRSGFYLTEEGRYETEIESTEDIEYMDIDRYIIVMK